MAHQIRDRAPEADALVSVAQAATLLGVHPNTIRAWTDAGRLTAYRINSRGDRRLRRSDVERLLVEEGVALAGARDQPNGEPRRLRDAALRVVARVARGAGSSDSAPLVSRVAVEAIHAELGYARAAAYLREGEELVLAMHAGYDVPPPARRPAEPLIGGTVAGSEGGRALELPLVHAGQPYGLLRVEDDRADALDEADLPVLRTLAETLAAMLRNAHTLARARRELRRSRALRAVTHELTGQLDPAAILDDVVERTRSLFGADRAGLWLLEPGQHPFRIAAQRGLSDRFIEAVNELRIDSDALGVRAINERRALWMRGAARDDSPTVMRGAYHEEGIQTVCLAPLIGRDEALGVIGLFHGDDREWPDDEVALLQAFANQAAIAIQNARLYRSVSDRTARLRSIQDLSARLNRLTDVTAIAEAIVAEATALADYHDIRVYRVDWPRLVCEPLAFTREMLGDDPGDAVARLRVRVGEGFTGWVAEHGESMLINDAVDDPRGKTIDGTDDIPESMLLVPMTYEGRTLGVIVLSQLGHNRFNADDLQTMTIFAGQAAQAFANADAYAKLRAQSSELARQLDSQRRLLEINERLLSTFDHQAVLESIADGLHAVVAYDNLSVWRADRPAQRLYPLFARDAYAEEVMSHVVPFGTGLMGWAVDHGEPVLSNDALNDPRTVQIPGTPAEPEAMIFVPLIADGEVIGAMNVGRIGEEAHFSAADFELVKLFASQASIALSNADTHRAVSVRAETDALTGLGNHGAFQRELAKVLGEGDGSAMSDRAALLMMDLDGFKAYNDRLGHPAGDALLHAVATAIYGAARTDDLVYRYGGDEFAIVLPDAGVTEAARVGERIRRAVAELTAANATAVTITVGVAAAPRDARGRSGLIAAADTALYYGKQLGGNRVVRVSEVPGDIRNLRGTLAELARVALRSTDEAGAVEQIVEHAARLASDEHQGAPPAAVRDALLAVVRSLDAHDRARRGNVDRVGRLAAAVAARLGMPPAELTSVELAARLHALAERGIDELEPIPSLHSVSRLIRAQRTLEAAGADGQRRPARPPLGAQVIAAAVRYDEQVSGRGARRMDRAAAIDRLRVNAVGIRPEVVAALAEVVAARPDRGTRRRRLDAAAKKRGAA
jgi:diguanylate cyclase (GGDEF)-like protein/excisionase family DNA binding protein